MDIDHKKHFIICAIATLLAFGLYAPFVPFWYVFSMCPMLGLGLGIGKEYGDSQASGNKWDLTDIVADLLGTASALAFLLAMYFLFG